MLYDLNGKRILFPRFDATSMSVILACMQAGAFCLLHDDNHVGGAIVARKTGGRAVGMLAQLDNPEHLETFGGRVGATDIPDIVIMGRSIKRLQASWQEMDADEHLETMLESLDLHFKVIDHCIALMAAQGHGILLNTSPMEWAEDMSSTVMQQYADASIERMAEVIARHPGDGYRAITLLPGTLPLFGSSALVELSKTPYQPGRYEKTVLTLIGNQSPAHNGDAIVYTAEGSLHLWA